MNIRPAFYLSVVVLGLVVGLVVAQRRGGIFDCQANGYSKGSYLAYCDGYHYGDYDHGAFWLHLEPAAERAAARADVLVLGNSRAQIAFTSGAVDAWFERRSRKYFLMGFMYDEPMVFARDVLHRLKPRAKVYVINLDSFFRDELSEPAKFVQTDREAISRYQDKRRWQPVHRAVCGKVPRICGRGEVWYRSGDTGAMTMEDAADLRLPVTESPTIDAAQVAREVMAGESFLADLGVPRSCVLFTLVPRQDAATGTAREIAAALKVEFIAPKMEGLSTRDGSHLDPAGVDRWSAEFLRQAGPALEACLGGAGASP
jgi:hypothetical protein